MKNRANIIYVIPDEFRQMAMGFRGQDPVITPNIDNFSKESLEFENTFSCYPVCSPHRAMLLTGQYPYSNGVIGNCNSATSQYGVFLKPKQTCLSDVLSQNGYDCGYIGKWHLDAPNVADSDYLEKIREDGLIWDAFTPKHKRHGFNFWYSYGCNDQHLEPHYWCNDDKVQDERKITKWSPEHETDIAVQYIQNSEKSFRDEQKPFALFVSYNPPHMPFEQVPEKYKKLYDGKTAKELLTSENAWLDTVPEEVPFSLREQSAKFSKTAHDNVLNYFAAVSGIDEQFGRILKAVQDKGLSEDTIVVFTSDHGEMMGSHGMMYKGLWYDESIKVPFLIRYPSRIKSGKSDCFINTPDIFPTILELVGLQDELPESVEGYSVADAMFGIPQVGEKAGYFVNPQINARGINDGDYLYVVIRDMYDGETNILYDLKKDVLQSNNVADENEHIVKTMRVKLQAWLERCNDIWVK